MTSAAVQSLSRRQRGRLLCGRVVEAIGRAAPPALGHWPPAWAIVADPSGRFLDLLHAWEDAEPPERARELAGQVQDAANAVVQAWCEAAAAWEAAGRLSTATRPAATVAQAGS